MVFRILWQIARLPIMLAIILTTGDAQMELARAVTRIDAQAATAPWFTLVGLTLLFAVVMLLGRSRDPSRTVLIIEAVIAAVIGLVPTTFWMEAFGFGAVPMALGAASGNMLVPGLALVWLVIALMRLVGALREHAAARRAEAAAAPGTTAAAGAATAPGYTQSAPPDGPPPGAAEDPGWRGGEGPDASDAGNGGGNGGGDSGGQG